MSKRIVGIDVTRALAIVGMIIVNFTLALGQNGNPFLVDLSKLFIGKASALFVVLAGVGITLMTKNVERDIPLWKAKPYLVLTKRALFVFVLGILLSSVWIADILHFYGVYILISLFVTRWSNRQVWIGCALLIFSYPLLLMVFDYTEAWDFDSLTYNDFWTLKGFFRNLFFNGFHPVLPWMAFMWFGIWLGRFDFRDEKRIRIASRRAAFIFFSIQILAYFIPFEESINTPSSFWATFLYTPSMPPLPLYMLSGMAFSTFILFSLVRLTHEHPQMRFVNSLVAMGQMALSIYILHVILGLGVIEEVGSKELGAYSIQFSFLYALGFSALMLLFSVVWKRFYHQGPFEYLMRRISSTGVK